MTRRYRRQPQRRRGLTAAQIAANDHAFVAAVGTITGRYSKGELVLSHTGQCYRVTTYGRRYHEDSTSCIYGVRPARPKSALKATLRLRKIIEQILLSGTQEPGSRALGEATGVPCPDVGQTAGWQDGRPGSLASYPSLTVYGDRYLRAVRPIYDDAPVIAWVDDPRLARDVVTAITLAPQPVHVAQVEVRLAPEVTR